MLIFTLMNATENLLRYKEVDIFQGLNRALRQKAIKNWYKSVTFDNYFINNQNEKPNIILKSI